MVTPGDRVAMIVVGALALSSAPVDAQSSWTAPRTPAGHPNLQAVWTNETITPFERPSSMAGKAVLTAEEAAGIEAQIADYRAASAANPTPGRVGAYNQFWMDAGTQVLKTRQTSLVVDPPDGRVPARPTAEATRDYNRALIAAHAGESYEYMSVWDRCISRGVARVDVSCGLQQRVSLSAGARLRGDRSRDDPRRAECLAHFSPDECRNYFRHCGYSATTRS